MRCFFDSSFLIASIIDEDDLHGRAKVLENQNIFNNECYISNLIINEVVTVIGNKTSDKIAKKVFNFLIDNFHILNEWEIMHFNHKVMNTYVEYNAKLSFTDSAIIELMKANKIENLVSFDKYFKHCQDLKVID